MKIESRFGAHASDSRVRGKSIKRRGRCCRFRKDIGPVSIPRSRDLKERARHLRSRKAKRKRNRRKRKEKSRGTNGSTRTILPSFSPRGRYPLFGFRSPSWGRYNASSSSMTKNSLDRETRGLFSKIFLPHRQKWIEYNYPWEYFHFPAGGFNPSYTITY